MLQAEFWKFARARWDLMVTGRTTDPILREFKFTNCYRVCDRVSQRLIREVIGDDQHRSWPETLFRTILFKTFNRESTWLLLGDLRWENGWIEEAEARCRLATRRGKHLFCAAFRYASGRSSYGCAEKYQNYLQLVQTIVQLHQKIRSCSCLEDLVQLLLGVPLVGPFTAMQHATDIGYTSCHAEYWENDYILPGPGCRRGAAKIFGEEYDVIAAVRRLYHEQYDRGWVGIPEHPLSLMDVQNLCCEFDKYLRIKKPELNTVGRGTRKPLTRPKQRYVPCKDGRITSWVFPRKWTLSEWTPGS